MLFKFVAGNKLNHALIKSEYMLKNKKIPIINYICENINNKKKHNIFSEYSNIIKNINSNYMIALKLSSLNFNEILINKIANLSKEKNIKLIIDAEDNNNIEKYRKITNNLIKNFNKDKLSIIKTYQMYRKDSLYELKDDIKFFNNVNFSAKLVRGAYWNNEKNGKHLFIEKKDTNNSFNNSLLECYNNLNNNFIIATHNKESIYLANNLKKKKNIILAHLMGMNEKMMNNNVNNNIQKACYIPYGPYKEMIPYLSRRLYENIDQIKYF